jgi:hypothetical protein
MLETILAVLKAAAGLLKLKPGPDVPKKAKRPQ